MSGDEGEWMQDQNAKVNSLERKKIEDILKPKKARGMQSEFSQLIKKGPLIFPIPEGG
jgi:hypothetical protein